MWKNKSAYSKLLRNMGQDPLGGSDKQADSEPLETVLFNHERCLRNGYLV